LKTEFDITETSLITSHDTTKSGTINTENFYFFLGNKNSFLIKTKRRATA